MKKYELKIIVGHDHVYYKAIFATKKEAYIYARAMAREAKKINPNWRVDAHCWQILDGPCNFQVFIGNYSNDRFSWSRKS